MGFLHYFLSWDARIITSTIKICYNTVYAIFRSRDLLYPLFIFHSLKIQSDLDPRLTRKLNSAYFPSKYDVIHDQMASWREVCKVRLSLSTPTVCKCLENIFFSHNKEICNPNRVIIDDDDGDRNASLACFLSLSLVRCFFWRVLTASTDSS